MYKVGKGKKAPAGQKPGSKKTSNSKKAVARKAAAVKKAPAAANKVVTSASIHPSQLVDEPKNPVKYKPKEGEKQALHIVEPTVSFPPNLAQTFQEVRLTTDDDYHLFGNARYWKHVPMGQFDLVWTQGTVNHLYGHELAPFFKHCFDALKEHGTFRLICVDMERATESYYLDRPGAVLYKTQAGQPIYAADLVYGNRSEVAEGNMAALHHSGFTSQNLAHYLKDTGYIDIRIEQKGFLLKATAFKRPHKADAKPAVSILKEDMNKLMEQRDNLIKPPRVPVPKLKL